MRTDLCGIRLTNQNRILRRILCLIILFLMLVMAGCGASKTGTEAGTDGGEPAGGQSGQTEENLAGEQPGQDEGNLAGEHPGQDEGNFAGEQSEKTEYASSQSSSTIKSYGDGEEAVTVEMSPGGGEASNDSSSAGRVDEMLGTNYKVVKVSKGNIRRVESYFGSFEYRHPIPLNFGYDGGVLEKIHVYSRQQVEKGDLLAEIKTDSIKEKIEQQRIALRRAEIILAQTEEMARSELKAARERLSGLQAKYEEAVAMPEFFSKLELEELEFQIAEAEINLSKAEQMYGSGDTGSKGFELIKAELDVKQAEEKLKQLEAQLEACRIVAPISGEISWVNRNLMPGDVVSGSDVIVTIADPEDVIFTFAEEANKAKNTFEIGMKGLVAANTTGGFSSGEYEGRILSFEDPDPYIISFNKNALNRISVFVDAPKGVFRNNSRADISIILEEARDTIIIPARALNSFGGRTFVYVLKDGLREERDVEVGIKTNVDVQITEGLKEGEEILMR